MPVQRRGWADAGAAVVHRRQGAGAMGGRRRGRAAVAAHRREEPVSAPQRHPRRAQRHRSRPRATEVPHPLAHRVNRPPPPPRPALVRQQCPSSRCLMNRADQGSLPPERSLARFHRRRPQHRRHLPHPPGPLQMIAPATPHRRPAERSRPHRHDRPVLAQTALRQGRLNPSTRPSWRLRRRLCRRPRTVGPPRPM
jgi:hypothetical protein